MNTVFFKRFSRTAKKDDARMHAAKLFSKK
jgi:hypothetical protein